jgi:hypothetical protein
MTYYPAKLELPNILRRGAPQAFAILMSCNKASYYASLLDALGKLICNTYFILSPCGDINTTPAPAPLTHLEPSKYMVQTLDKLGGPVFCNSSHSAVKSSKICDLIAFRFSYIMSRGKVLFPTRRHVLLL